MEHLIPISPEERNLIELLRSYPGRVVVDLYRGAESRWTVKIVDPFAWTVREGDGASFDEAWAALPEATAPRALTDYEWDDLRHRGVGLQPASTRRERQAANG